MKSGKSDDDIGSPNRHSFGLQDAIAGATPAVAKVLSAIESAPEGEARERAIAEAYLLWGNGALHVLTPLVGDTSGIYFGVLMGEIPTGRADEGIRRAELCRQVLGGAAETTAIPLVLRLAAAEGILQLSNVTSSVLRADERPRAACILSGVAADAREAGLPELEVRALSSLLVYGCIEGQAAEDAAQRLADLEPDLAGAIFQGVARAGQLQEMIVRAAMSPSDYSLDAIERAVLGASSSGFARPGDAVAALAAAQALHAGGREDLARQLLGMVVEQADCSSLLGRMLRADAATALAHSLLGIGDGASAVAAVEPSLAFLESEYCAAVTPDEISRAKERFAAAGEVLFEAYARQNDHSALFVLADRLKGIRSRDRAALRLSPVGRKVLQVERQMFLAARGATAPIGDARSDQFAAAVPAIESFREQLRELREGVQLETSPSPTPQELARELGCGEGVLVLGLSNERTVIFLVAGSDGGQERVERWDLDTWPEKRWFDLLEDWLTALIAGEPEAGDLDGLLQCVDSVVGAAIQGTVERWRISRLYLVAHRELGALPLWALPSLRSVDVVAAPSTAAIVDQHHVSPPVLGDRALLVVNPTEDLSVAAAQMSDVRRRLSSTGFSVVSLPRSQASGAAVREALPEASIFHFVGHGKRDVLRPESSALLVAPREGAMWPSVGPLLNLLVDGWETEADGGRSQVLTGIGRVTEWSSGRADVDRRVETNFETYFGRWRQNDVVFPAELLTAEELASGARLARCGLAVLMACETGPVDVGTVIVGEPGGLAAALHQAGAPTVVATSWPIRETTSLVFSTLLYEELLADGPVVDVSHAVRVAASRLKEMGSEHAAALLSVQEASSCGREAFRLRALANQIAGGPAQPFADPAAWAPFFVTGSPVVTRKPGQTVAEVTEQ